MTPLCDFVYEGRWFTINRLQRQGKRKTDTYEVLTKECEVIGHISWYGPWRKYAYFPEPETVMESICMQEIATFLRQITWEHTARKLPDGHDIITAINSRETASLEALRREAEEETP